MKWQEMRDWVRALDETEASTFLLATSNVFLIPKKNNGIRLVFTGENINRFVFRDLSFPLPDAAILLRYNFAWMAKVDLSHAFMHFPMSEEIQRYLGVEIGDKFWHYKRMPWGASYAPYVL